MFMAPTGEEFVLYHRASAEVVTPVNTGEADLD
jgi:hypothetical protein